MSAPLPCEKLNEMVIRTGLCTRCGTCVGACPVGNLTIPDPTGSCLPVAGDTCTSCGLCLAGCPGKLVNFRPVERSLFGDAEPNRFLGVVRRAYIGYASDPVVRLAGASGGVVTSLLIGLLGEGRVRGAVLYARHDTEPWRGWGRIARTDGEIRDAAQSRYHLSPMNTVLGEIVDEEGPFAYAGLPCHVHGLRKLEGAGWDGNSKIGPVIGVYCGNNLYFEATRVMLRKLGVSRLSDVESLSYREGIWPGSFMVRTKDGSVRSISKLDFNQTIPFYVNHRCLTCIDLTNELADVSVGDGWAKDWSTAGGWSVILTRSEAGEEILERARGSGMLYIEDITIEQAEQMHSHAFDLKKAGAFIRLGLWKKWGYPVPRYDRESPTATRGRKLTELIVSMQFIILSSRPGRLVFGILPAGALGAFFRGLRKMWIALTRNKRVGG